MLIPTVWDAFLVPRSLEMGPFGDYNAYGHLISDSGRAVGFAVPIGSFMNEAAAQGAEFELPTIFWVDGAVDLSMSGPLGPNSAINSITSGGELLGQIQTLPAYWVDGVSTQIELPDGFAAGGLRSINGLGDRAGTLFRTEEPYTGAVPFILSAAGELQVLDAPAGTGPDWPGRLQVFDLQDDGSFFAVMRGETDLFGSAVRYGGGTQTPIADLNGEGLFVRDANANGVLVGQSMLNGISIPTMWVNDQPIMIADLIVPGPDLLFLDVNAINDSGVMIGEAQDSSGVVHHVVLRPV
jgi:hypothetical protein